MPRQSCPGRDLPGCRTSRTWAGSRAGLPVRGRGPAARTWPSVRSWPGTWCCRKPMRRRWLGLKFSDAAEHLAVATLARCLADLENASHVLAEPVRFVSAGLEGPWGAVGNRAEDALWRGARAGFGVFLAGWVWPRTASALYAHL